MTIKDRIIQTLKEMEGNPTLYNRASKLNESVEELLVNLIDHLGEIDKQLSEYDKHDESHSERVLKNIEELILEKGIAELSFLEALILRLCCYFHDAGMILPQCYVPLMEQIEMNPVRDPEEGLDTWLTSKKKGYANIKGQFYCPDSDVAFEDFLIDQLEGYKRYCMGLEYSLEASSKEDYFRNKRHEYLRNTHGERVRVYSQNLPAQFLQGLSGSGREDLQKVVGDICASHCWEIGEVKKLPAKLEILSNCPEMTCNVRYLAMLLRLGDVLHFSSDRVSKTVYVERDPMGDVSDRHWMVKLGDLSYTISARMRDRKIAFDGSFDDPKSYYFLQDHLNRIDEELENYANFVSDMHAELDCARYALGLPTAVDRDRVRAVGFKPDQDLKFKLEHQKIITLLMGMQLYRDEFMCLRELYQNALDASSCMQAEIEIKGLRGNLEIEFGLGTDDGGDYLYCKDQGIGMTLEIVKNYLLRIGNSYYQSAEFRRANAGWGGKVAPVSEFGIGLLSCYMIASRIEVITRHHTKTDEKPIWISMECSDDYGYFKNSGRREERLLGSHGTVVKLYLLDKYKSQITSYLPEHPEDDVYKSGLLTKILTRNENSGTNQEEISASTGISIEVLQKIDQYEGSLYNKILKYVSIPKVSIPVYIRVGDSRIKLINSQKPYKLFQKMPALIEEGFKIPDILSVGIMHAHTLGLSLRLRNLGEKDRDALLIDCLQQFQVYQCSVVHETKGAEAFTIIHLPKTGEFNVLQGLHKQIDQAINARKINWRDQVVYIDGMPVEIPLDTTIDDREIQYNFCGSIRPSLTVDRGSIKLFSSEASDLKEELHGMILDEIVRHIEMHFQKFPSAVTAEALRYLCFYLRQKFNYNTFYYIVMSLTDSVFRSYSQCGVDLQKIVSSDEILFHDADGEDGIHANAQGVLYGLLGEANFIAVAGKNVIVKKYTESHDGWKWNRHEYDSDLMIAVDEWYGCYEQYDIVNTLWPLIPQRFADLNEMWHGISKGRKYKSGPYAYMNSINHIAEMDTIRPWYQHEAAGMSDVLLLLTETSENRRVHRLSGNLQLKEENDKRYIIFAYIVPQALTEEDKKFVAQYDNVPRYREGVEKGWSIMFYNYKNGYVIAPGIVDRMEMLKLLPQEALNHDDGLEYYFTDGTFAF